MCAFMQLTSVLCAHMEPFGIFETPRETQSRYLGNVIRCSCGGVWNSADSDKSA